MQHARKLHVVGVDGLAGHLTRPFNACDGLADVAVFALHLFFADIRLLRHIRLSSYFPAFAACITAS